MSVTKKSFGKTKDGREVTMYSIGNDKGARADIIKKISRDKYEKFIQSNIGTTQEVLIEKHPDKKTGMFKGITRNYLNVLLEDGEFNTMRKVILTRENLQNNYQK